VKPESIVIIALFVSFAALEAAKTGFFVKKKATRSDGIVETSTAIILLLIAQPGIILVTSILAGLAIPEYANALADIPFIAGFVLLLFTDDLLNYFWHRNAHNRPSFYKLHRPHHEGGYMSVRVVFRNNTFYYLLAPYYWTGGILFFLGITWPLVVYTCFKALITFACHSDICWDKPLYKNRWTSALMFVVERVIVTPSFHHAHHGKHIADGVTHYKTAHITREFPNEYGIEDLPPTTIGEQLFWPLIKSSPPIVESQESSLKS